MRTSIFLCAVGLLSSGPSEGDRCERAAAVYAQANAKVLGCVGPDERAMAVDVPACRATTDACGTEDRRAIDRFLECVALLPTCEGADLGAWRAQYEACAAGIALSGSCSL